MLDLNKWQEILETLRANKVRTLLTGFTVAWGIFMLVVMLGAGNGFKRQVRHLFSGGAKNSFVVWPQVTGKPYLGLPAGRPVELTNDETALLRVRVPEVDVIAPRNRLGGQGGDQSVVRGDRAGSFAIIADCPEIRQIEDLPVGLGRFLNHADIRDKRKVAVIGSRVRKRLFDRDEDPIGESIRIYGVHFTVVGVIEPEDASRESDLAAGTIHVPFTTSQHALNLGNSVGEYAFTARPGVSVSAAEEMVLAVLKRRLRVHPDDDRALGHYNQEREFEKLQGLFAGIGVFIWIVGAGTLAAGVVGISNIMLISVRERTTEIGVRRAVGATPWAIVSHVVLEAVLVTSLAGYFGLLAGLGVLELARVVLVSFEKTMFANPNVGLSTVAQALAILVLSGVVAGAVPARRAVRIRPVEALRAIA